MNQETVLAKVSAYAPAEHVDQLRQTLSQAEHVFRHSPHPDIVTITRPVSVALILADWQVPVSHIEIAIWSAALPVVNREELLSHLNEEQARIATHLVSFMGLLTEYRLRRAACEIKLPILSNFWHEGFFVLLVAMFLDAFRHCAHSQKMNDKKEMASQALTIFNPIISELLGLHAVEKELGDLIFQCENALQYEEIKKHIDNQQRRLQSTIEAIESIVRNKAGEYGITELELKHEVAHPYMIKASKYNGRLDVSDLVSFVAYLPDEEACYRFLRPLHMHGNMYRDPNGYHPLHLRVHMEPYGPVNFYIRTLEGDKEYNYGLLNRYWNGEKGIFEKVDDLIPHRRSHIIVYSKYGVPYPLPYHATPVDLAYKINEMTGHSYSGAYILGKGPVKGDYPLGDGDIVEIMTGHRTEPDQTWLESVKTAEARKFISQWKARQAARNNGNGKVAKGPAPSQVDREITDAVNIPSEYEGTPCHRCIHCSPYPPQPICAYVTHHGLTIHRTSCGIHDRTQTIPISWRESNVRSISRVLTIEAWDHAGLLREIFEKLADYKINIIQLDAESRTDATAHIVISLHETNREVVEKICHTLHKMSAVHSIAVDQPQETTIGAPYASRTGARIFNPYTQQPVTNPGIFFGRRNEMQRIWRALESGGQQNSILFWGQQHIGKTSLLKHFEARTLEDATPYYVPVYLSMQGWQQHQKTNDLVLWFANQMHQSLDHLSTKPQFHFQIPEINHAHLRDNPEAALEGYFHQLQRAVSPERLIVMIDEFQGLEQMPNRQGEVLLRCLEHLLENFGNLSFIFAGWGRRSIMLHRLQRLAPVVPLGVLEPQSAEDLIRLPVRPFIYEPGVIEKIKEVTHCHPYYIHLICGKIIDDAIERPITERFLTKKDFNRAVDKLLLSDGGLFGQLLEATVDSDIVLDALARSPASAERYVEVSALLSKLKIRLSPHHILDVLEALAELEVLEQSKEDSNMYRIRLPLFQQWLKRNPQFHSA